MNPKLQTIIAELEERITAYGRSIGLAKHNEIKDFYQKRQTALRVLVEELKTGQLDLEARTKK